MSGYGRKITWFGSRKLIPPVIALRALFFEQMVGCVCYTLCHYVWLKSSVIICLRAFAYLGEKEKVNSTLLAAPHIVN